jgi:hypothetical protein
MSLFFYRLIAAAMLDAAMYEGIEADRRVTFQAAAAVILASLAAGFGATGLYGGSLRIFVMFSVIALITWGAWATLMFQLGTRLLPEPETRATLGQLLRTTGFAAAPGLLQVFAVFPAMAVPVFAGTTVWMFAAMVIGVRHALDYQSTWRALAVCAVAGALSLGLAILFSMLFGSTVS